MLSDINYYRSILDNMPEGVQIIDFNCRYLYVNESVVKRGKYSREELIGHSILEKYPEIKNSDFWFALQNSMRNRVVEVVESNFIYPDASKGIFEIRIQPIPEGVLITSLDRSDKINAKQELQTSHDGLLFHLEHTPLGFIQWDGNMKVQTVSKRATEIFGWSEEEFKEVGHFGKRFIYKDDLELARRTSQELMLGNVENNKLLIRCSTKNGDYLWCEWFNSVLKNKQGEIINIVSLIDDVTIEKLNENNLRKVNRLVAFLSATNQSIARFKKRQELFDNICSIAIDIGKFKTAWIALLSGKSKLTIISIMGEGHTGFDYLHYSGMDFLQTPFRNTTISKVLQTSEYAISNNVQQDEGMKIWWHIYERLGIKSSIALPLIKNEELVGVIGFNASVENFFDDAEVELLVEAAVDIGFAIQTIEQSEKHASTEKLIEYSEKRFRALIEKSQEVIALSSISGKIIYCSPSVTKILGYTSKELLNINSFDTIHPTDLKAFLEERKSILQMPGSHFTMQLRIKHKNGSWLWCECTFTNHLHEPGINAIVSNFIDISDRKLAEQRRQFDQNNLDALINSTQDLMWSLYKDFTLITFNQPFESLVNSYSGKAVLKGSDMRNLNIPLERLQRMQSFYERAFNGESFTETQYIDEPQQLWYEISFAPIYKNEDVIGAACHARNITRRKTIEQQLRSSEAFNKGMIDSLTAHIAVIDIKGVIIAVNESWKRFADSNVDTALLRAFLGNNYINNLTQSALTGDVAASEAVNGIVDVMNKKQEIFYFEYPCLADGKEYWFSMRVKKFESDDSLMVISQQDISSRKQAELERTNIVNALVQRNKDLEQFSYIVSHNLRAPVANIIGAADIINEAGLTQEDRETLIKGLAQSSKRLDEVLKDMNFILKVRDVNNQSKEKLNLTELFNSVIGDIHYLTDDNSIIITSDFSEINELYSFKTYLYSIFYNLITNSIKYRQFHRQTFITITSFFNKEDNIVTLIFKDNGIGINLEKKGKEVFGLYKRFHTNIEGKGMGLFLVKTQVESLGGKIFLESHENIGSEFRIELPYIK